jgi:hypothetical protein
MMKSPPQTSAPASSAISADDDDDQVGESATCAQDDVRTAPSSSAATAAAIDDDELHKHVDSAAAAAAAASSNDVDDHAEKGASAMERPPEELNEAAAAAEVDDDKVSARAPSSTSNDDETANDVGTQTRHRHSRMARRGNIRQPLLSEQAVTPGAMFIPGAGFVNPALRSEDEQLQQHQQQQQVDDGSLANNANETGNGNDEEHLAEESPGGGGEELVVLEGFLPPLRLTPRQRTERRLRHLMENAITLDESAVVAIPDDNDGSNRGAIGGGSGGSDGGEKNNQNDRNRSRRMHSRSAMMAGVVGISLLIVIGFVVNSRRSIKEEEDLSASPGYSCGDIVDMSSSSPYDQQERYLTAKTIVSQITNITNLNDNTTPQSKALHWLTCNDDISATLIDNKDPVTGLLPKQAHGSVNGGDSGEAHVLRRYILATLYYSTSLEGDWDDDWNFLSGDVHE